MYVFNYEMLEKMPSIKDFTVCLHLFENVAWRKKEKYSVKCLMRTEQTVCIGFVSFRRYFSGHKVIITTAIGCIASL